MTAEREATAKVRDIVNKLSMYSPDEVAQMNAVKEELLAGAKDEHVAGMAAVQEIITKARKKKAV